MHGPLLTFTVAMSRYRGVNAGEEKRYRTQNRSLKAAREEKSGS
jgi:hypothetical protein